MYEKLNDRYDSMVAYISHNEEKISVFNLGLVNDTLIFYSILYGILFGWNFLFVPSFRFHPIYLLPVPFILLFWKLKQVPWERIRHQLAATRIFCFLFYFIFISTMSLVEAFAAPGSRGLLFPLLLVAFSAFYVDYFFVLLAFRAALFGMNLVWILLLKNPDVYATDILFAVLAVLAGTFCYMIVLGTQGDRWEDGWLSEERSQRDLLTGLLNKISFEEKVKEYLDRREKDECCALFIIDFDDFKHVNDSYGHLTGDRVLKRFGEILWQNFQGTDLVGRMGGDEFMVFWMGEIPEGYIEKRCEIIQKELNEAWVDLAHGFSCSIGVAVDRKGLPFDRIYQVADDALYKAKERGKKGYVMREIERDIY